MNGMIETAVPDGVYLRSCLAPFEEALSRADVSDVYVNRPGELWIETIGGGIERHECAAICELTLARFARQVAALSSQGVNREHPLLAAMLPDGSRVQVVAPPATRGFLALAIRRHISRSMTLRDLEAAGSFSGTRVGPSQLDERERIRRLMERGNFADGLVLAVRSRLNIVISGGTSSGKTNFLNALLAEIPADERLIIIEDTPELRTEHANSLGLLASRSELGEARVTMNDLVSASLRMRPDRIIVGELRGSEAFAFLRAVNSGHPGSMTTIHADSPERAIEQLTMLVLQALSALRREDVRDYVRQSIDLIIQLRRISGRRVVETIMPQSAQ